jgi:hypothetical protein
MSIRPFYNLYFIFYILYLYLYLSSLFRFEGKDFRHNEEGWEETINYYRNSHKDRSIPFPKCLLSQKVKDKSGEMDIDYIIGPMADVKTKKGEIRNLKKLQLCIKSKNLEEQFKYLNKIIFCKITVKIILGFLHFYN